MNDPMFDADEVAKHHLWPVIAQAQSGPVVIWVTKAVKDAIDAVPEEDKRLPELHPAQKTESRID
jgi:hypothetical protein